MAYAFRSLNCSLQNSLHVFSNSRFETRVFLAPHGRIFWQVLFEFTNDTALVEKRRRKERDLYTSPKLQGLLRGEYMYIMALSQCKALTLSYFELFTPEFLIYASLMLDLWQRASSHYMLLWAVAFKSDKSTWCRVEEKEERGELYIRY
jgi:hypothetical protein